MGFATDFRRVHYRRPIKTLFAGNSFCPSPVFLASFGGCSPVFVYDYRRAVPHAAVDELLHEQCSTELPHNQDIKPRIWGSIPSMILRLGPREY